MSALQFCFEAVFPLFAFTHPDLGGLGLPVSLVTFSLPRRCMTLTIQTQTIGFILAMSALMSIAMTLVLFPLLHRAISSEYYLSFCEWQGLSM